MVLSEKIQILQHLHAQKVDFPRGSRCWCTVTRRPRYYANGRSIMDCIQSSFHGIKDLAPL